VRVVAEYANLYHRLRTFSDSNLRFTDDVYITGCLIFAPTSSKSVLLKLSLIPARLCRRCGNVLIIKRFCPALSSGLRSYRYSHQLQLVALS
jgi:hypothetical protein